MMGARVWALEIQRACIMNLNEQHYVLLEAAQDCLDLHQVRLFRRSFEFVKSSQLPRG
jgi:hypothetical protein